MANIEHDRVRDDRLLRYGARPLDQSRWILIRTTPGYAETYAGQVAILVAANLIGRMSRSVALEVPRTTIVSPLPGAGGDLVSQVLHRMVLSDPNGRYERRCPEKERPYVVHLGANGHDEVVHGSGWNAYIGPPASPLASCEEDPYNPIGPAFGAIAAATRLFVYRFNPPAVSRIFDCYAWNDHEVQNIRGAPERPTVARHPWLGDLWCVGCGSVGSAILYFLALSGAKFSASLFDMDHIKCLNITRSPIFDESDVKQPKVRIVANFLKHCGVGEITEYPMALDEANVWQARPAGTPDLLIPAANERNVRSLIESYLPPLQIYGTTGANWQASVISHVPMMTGCSRCLFPGNDLPRTVCAEDPDARNSSPPDDEVDASLPFLSFAAGLMAAADILKVATHHYPYIGRRGMLSTWGGLRLQSVPPRTRSGCPCHGRDQSVYRSVLGSSQYANI